MDPQYTLRLEKIEAVLERELPAAPPSSWTNRIFAGMNRPVSPDLLKTLIVPGWDLLHRGGKRWRPLLMTLICETLGGGDAALPLAPLVEFPHNASLIHDDIEDNAEERRGEPAVHIRYGVDAAINGGCFLYFLPLAYVESWDAPVEQKDRVYRLWGEYMRRLHLGQAMDIAWHRDFFSLPAPEEYDTMCRLKTGCLAGLAAVLGAYAAIAANDPAGTAGLYEKEAPLIRTAGEAAEKLGVGFQILDDVKNLTTGNHGKKRGDDIVEGKKSLPVLLYLHRRRDRGEFVARCFSAARTGGTGAGEVEELIGELDSAGVLEEAKSRGLSLIREARDAFSAFSGSSLPVHRETQSLLAGLTELIS
ncbi:MAG: polyprenyl synthetase family protein [Spirochaetaceae bacterium]|jgi:octaprenyl-diphosphate synthase|nr:polyprenyl synthetase family protein [Spirochaetaceae bacterium]